jgi:twinkle protein
MLTIVTGHPNSGKSEWLDQVLMELAERHRWNLCIASFENPIQLHIAKLIEKRLNKTFFKRALNRMTESEVMSSKEFIDEHFKFLDFSQGAMPTISEVLDRAGMAVQRYGCRGLVIDPFNNLIPETKEGWSTERISEMLTRVKRFALERGVHVWVVAHPAKMLRFSGKLPIPEGNDISGSHTWWSKADHGITVHRKEDGAVMLRSWKSRFK